MSVEKYPYIHSISYYLPDKKLANSELSNIYEDWNEQKVFLKLGIEERCVAGDNEFVSDMAEKAALKLLEESLTSAEDIDFIILCTQSPDYFLPTTACILQERLGVPKGCGAFDFNLGCSGFIYGLAMAKSLLNDNLANNILLIMSETYTKHIHPFDKSVRPIFGDAASAILIKRGTDDKKIGSFTFGTDGSGANNLIIHAGGMKIPKNDITSKPETDKYGNTRSQENLYMNGPEIFKFVMNHIPGLVKETLVKNSLSLEEVDLFVFHQASRQVLESLRDKLGIPEAKFYINMSKIGNTVSASIPIALKFAQEEGRLKRGDKIMLVGFGVGYSWGATVITW